MGIVAAILLVSYTKKEEKVKPLHMATKVMGLIIARQTAWLQDLQPCSLEQPVFVRMPDLLLNKLPQLFAACHCFLFQTCIWRHCGHFKHCRFRDLAQTNSDAFKTSLKGKVPNSWSILVYFFIGVFDGIQQPMVFCYQTTIGPWSSRLDYYQKWK